MYLYREGIVSYKNVTPCKICFVVGYYYHACYRVAMLQLEICKFLAGDLVS